MSKFPRNFLGNFDEKNSHNKLKKLIHLQLHETIYLNDSISNNKNDGLYLKKTTENVIEKMGSRSTQGLWVSFNNKENPETDDSFVQIQRQYCEEKDYVEKKDAEIKDFL